MNPGLIISICFVIVISGGIVALYNTGDVEIQCTIKEPGVVQEHEIIEHHTIPHANLISVTTAKEEDHSVAVVRGLKGTQMFSYPGKCKAVK